MQKIQNQPKQLITAEQISEYRRLDLLEKEIKVKKEEIKTLLMDAMDSVGLRKMESDQFVVTLVETKRSSLEDMEALEAWHEVNNMPFDTQEIPTDWVMNGVKESIKKGVVPNGIKLSTSIFLKVTPRKQK